MSSEYPEPAKEEHPLQMAVSRFIGEASQGDASLRIIERQIEREYLKERERERGGD